jgi:drug/metabolite transporter (DMT)-like permease
MSHSEEHLKFGRSDLHLLAATASWAVNLLVIKVGFRELAPHAFNGLRLMLASAVYGIILFRGKEGFGVEKADRWKVAGLALAGVTFYQVFFISGFYDTAASTSSMIMAMTPIFIALLSCVFKLECLPRSGWLGIFISFAGFYFVITKQNGGSGFSWHNLKGDLLILAANFCWAVYTVFSKPVLERISPVKLAGLTTMFGTILYLPFAANEIVRIPWRDISWVAWGTVLYSAMFAIVISFVLWYRSVQRVGNTRTGIYGYVTPVFTTILAFIFLSERISGVQVAGVLIIFAGVYLTRSGPRLLRALRTRNARSAGYI